MQVLCLDHSGSEYLNHWLRPNMRGLSTPFSGQFGCPGTPCSLGWFAVCPTSAWPASAKRGLRQAQCRLSGETGSDPVAEGLNLSPTTVRKFPMNIHSHAGICVYVCRHTCDMLDSTKLIWYIHRVIIYIYVYI